MGKQCRVICLDMLPKGLEGAEFYVVHLYVQKGGLGNVSHPEQGILCNG